MLTKSFLEVKILYPCFLDCDILRSDDIKRAGFEINFGFKLTSAGCRAVTQYSPG
jgi:hypothetical protein